MTANVFDFSREAHESIGQVRKGGGPYWEHPLAVVQKLEEVGVTDEGILAAAFLHDVLEDVYPENNHYSPELIKNEFGADVLRLVFELTDVFTKEAFPQYNRKERKVQETTRLSVISDRAKVIKIADIWHNSLTLDQVLGGFGGIWAAEKNVIVPVLEPEEIKWKSFYYAILADISLA